MLTAVRSAADPGWRIPRLTSTCSVERSVARLSCILARLLWPLCLTISTPLYPWRRARCRLSTGTPTRYHQINLCVLYSIILSSYSSLESSTRQRSVVYPSLLWLIFNSLVLSSVIIINIVITSFSYLRHSSLSECIKSLIILWSCDLFGKT